MLKRQVQTALNALFPPSCVGCHAPVDTGFALCGPCWRSVPLISGPVCRTCGVPLLAEVRSVLDQCDSCECMARPWHMGRAAMEYRDMGRKLVLGLKYGDRHDVAITASQWLAQVCRPMLLSDTVIVPIPLHWSRLVKRRYNQAALLAQQLALRIDRRACLDALHRTKRTKTMEGASVADRFEMLRGSMAVNPRRVHLIQEKPVLLVDDVMTSGATLTQAAQACLAAGASGVDVLVLARACKEDYIASRQ